MLQYAIAAHSKLENFAPRISLCAERGVLSIRNANIVTDDIIANKQTGIYHFKSRKDKKSGDRESLRLLYKVICFLLKKTIG